MSKILKVINDNDFILYIKDTCKSMYQKYFVSDKRKIEKGFKKKLGRKVNLRNPVKYNDKLQWLKLYWNNPIATICADKYLVRSFIKKTIGEEYLNELLGVYQSVEEISLKKLPNSFVLKGTHGSGFNIVCQDKDKMNWNKEFKKMKRWLRTNYYLSSREWVYKDIKPRIICEKYIEQGEGMELRDYRFFCFDGEPKFVSVDLSITNKSQTRRNLYDLNWNLLDGEISYPKELSIKIKKPTKFNEMIKLSRKLSSNFPHARIDFYQIKDKVIFGEITFFHQGGIGEFRPPEFEIEVGNYLTLPKKI